MNEAASMADPSAKQPNLDPILEENNTQQLAVYQPNMSLSEQRKLKNDELKKRVKMLTNPDQLDTESIISSASSRPDDFFITNTKTKDKKKNKAIYKNADSPTARAAKALALMRNNEDRELEEEMRDEMIELGNPGELAIQEVNRTEREMNAMMHELNEIES